MRYDHQPVPPVRQCLSRRDKGEHNVGGLQVQNQRSGVRTYQHLLFLFYRLSSRISLNSVKGINVNKPDEAEPLGNLPQLKPVFMSLPKAPTTYVFRVVANAVTLKIPRILITNLIFKMFYVEACFWSVDARSAHALLYFKQLPALVEWC